MFIPNFLFLSAIKEDIIDPLVQRNIGSNTLHLNMNAGRKQTGISTIVEI